MIYESRATLTIFDNIDAKTDAWADIINRNEFTGNKWMDCSDSEFGFFTPGGAEFVSSDPGYGLLD